MTPVADVIRTVSHPLVRSIYAKKDFSTPDPDDNVLVIETNFEQQSMADHDNFDSYLIDLLADLQELKEQAEKEVGTISRVDIRTH